MRVCQRGCSHNSVKLGHAQARRESTVLSIVELSVEEVAINPCTIRPSKVEEPPDEGALRPSSRRGLHLCDCGCLYDQV